MTEFTERLRDEDRLMPAPLPVPADPFRQAFRELASGVCVIAFEVDGAVHGLTATSLTSVSMEPPLALFCLSGRSQSRRHLKPGQRIGMSVLGAGQAGIAHAFAAATPEGGYAGIDMDRLDGGPVVAGALAVLAADIVECHRAGEGTIHVCALRAARLGTRGEPLLYHARGYWRRQRLGLDPGEQT